MNSVTFTESQRKALDLSHGKVVLAGAGSGKTTVLTTRYLRLLEEKGIQPREIAAVTFTRKAAAQLFAKVHGELIERERTDTEQTELWRKCREGMPWARIGTIHSLCATLLRSFPLEAHVDPEFTVDNSPDPDRTERIKRHVRSLAYKRDKDLNILLDAVGKRETVEWLIRTALEDRALWEALQEALEQPDETAGYLAGTLTYLIKNTGIDSGVMPGNHTVYVERLNALARIIKQLPDQVSGPALRLSYNDLEQYTLRLLQNHPETARTIRRRIRYLLVDEFQDNSTIQWEIIRLLAHGGDDTFDKNKLFLVGDEKQSIYGFRGANVTVVRNALREMTGTTEREAAEKTDYFVNMNDNFRTLPKLVHPLNGVFDRLLASGGARRMSFEAEPQELVPRRETPKGIESSFEVALGLERSHEEVARYLARRIKEELGSQISDSSGEVRKLRENDIAILLRTRTRLEIIERALTEAGIPFQSSKGGGFFDHQEVRDLMHLIAALADPRDAIALVGVLRSPLFNMSDAAISALIIAGKTPFENWENLGSGELPAGLPADALCEDDIEALAFGYRLWKSLELRAISATASELLLFALEESGALAAYNIGLGGEQRVANIYRFIDKVRELGGEGHYTLRMLNLRLQEMAESEDSEFDTDTDISMGEGVNIMTIHGAKGLEFPFVILADLATKPRGGDSNRCGNLMIPLDLLNPLTHPRLSLLNEEIESDEKTGLHDWMRENLADAESAAEMKRLMYVSATRARDRLLLVSRVPRGRGRNAGIAVPKGSPLERWLDAFGVEISPEGSIEGSDIDGIKMTLIQPEQCEPFPDSGSGMEDDFDPKVDWQKIVPATIDPEVQLASPPLPDRMLLPITAFASYLANPGEEALRKLFWYSSGEEEYESEPDMENVAIASKSGGKASEPAASAEIGVLIHDLYNRYGPGCSWEEAEDEVFAWLKRCGYAGNEAYTNEKRVKEMLQSGQRLELNNLRKNGRREMTLLLRLGNALLRGRADLVVRNGNSAVVYDYKTNNIKSDQVETEVKKYGYEHQARIYALAISKAWGIQDVYCRLVFLAPEVFHDIRFSPTDETEYSVELERLWQKWAAFSKSSGL